MIIVQTADHLSRMFFRSVKEKAEFAKKLGLAGVMVWSIDTDDFRNTCDQGKYPLLKALNIGLRG